jgi:hypothetical protein
MELTTINDLKLLAKDNGIKLDGVYSRDRIDIDKIRSSENSNNIINLDSVIGNGTHWVCLLKRGVMYIYFDSFGIQPPQEIINIADGSELYYSDTHIQDIDFGYCGQYCISFIKNIDYPTSLKQLVNNYNNFINNFDEL